MLLGALVRKEDMIPSNLSEKEYPDPVEMSARA